MKKSCHKVTAVIPALLLVACVDNRNDFTGASPNSEETTASLPAPENLSATASDNEVSLSWDTVDGASAYNVYIYNQSGYIQSNYSPANRIAADTSASAIVNTNSHLLSSLEYEVDYYFNVTALADDLESNQSNEVGVRPLQNFSNSSPSVQLLNTNVNAAEVVTLSAEVSDPDGNNISYLWQQTSGASVEIVDGNESEAYFTAPTVDTPVELGFALTVFDNLGASSTSSATVTVSDNLVPQVDAGADQSVSSGATVNLLGSVSDSDGSVVDIAWQQDSGSIVSLSNTSTLATSFTAPSATSSELTLVFQLSATDDRGDSATDTVSVIVTADQATTTIYRVEVAENSNGTIHVATTMDPEQESLTYSLSGTDAANFSIDSSSGAISFLSTPDYEVPTDANTDNAYELTFAVSNGTTTTLQELVITVTDVDEAPTITSAPDASTPENTTSTFTATATDPESTPLSYSLSGTDDATNFTIDPSSGAISFTTIPDYENPADSDANNVYSLTLEVSDSTHTTSQALSITVTNIDEPPSITSTASVSILENTTTTIHTASATDPENDTLSYSLSATDAAHLSINPSSGTISFAINPDHENPADADANNVYKLTLEVSDSTHTTSQALAITVEDANDNAPIIIAAQSFSIDENSANGSIIGTVIATDVDASPTTYQDWTITSGNTNAAFAIDSSSGELSVATGSELDHESTASYTLELSASDGVNTASAETLSINVDDVNDNAPIITPSQSFEIAENSTDGSIIGTVVATDVDTIPTTYQDWTITSGNTEEAFAIDASSGELSVATGSELDYESAASYTLALSVSDGVNSASAETLSINLSNVNEQPSFTSAVTASANENDSSFAYTATATDVDAADSLAYSISGGADAAAFTLTGASLGFIATPNYESPTDSNEDNIYQVELQVTDAGGLSDYLDLQISVINVNEAPIFTSVDATVDVPENTSGTIYTLEASDTDSDDTDDTLTYSIAGGADQLSFSLDGAELSFINPPNYENPQAAGSDANIYTVELAVSDDEGEAAAANLILSFQVTDVNEAPNFTGISGTYDVAENTADTIFTLEASDVDSGDTDDTLTYSIAGGADQLSFSLDGAKLSFAIPPPDYENPQAAGADANIYTVELAVSDDDGKASETNLILSFNVTDVNEAPTITSTTNTSVPENTTTTMYSASATDPENDTLTYSLSGTDQDDFIIDPSSGALAFANTPDHESPTDADTNNVYQVTLEVSDGNANTATQALTITVTDVNEAPTITSATSANILENNTTTIYTASATDPENDTLTYSLSGTDQDDFIIDPSSGALSFADTPDHETPTDADTNNVYQITLEVSDGNDNTTSLVLTITVTDVNEAPTITSATSANILENNTTTIYTASATDPENDTLTYSLSGTDKDDFIIDSSSGAISFVNTPDHESPTDADTDNVYQVTLEVSDSNANTATQVLAIEVTNVNETPTITSATSANILENNTTTIYTASATDPENDTLTYDLSGTDQDDFIINPSSGAISFANTPDHETPTDADNDNVYQVTLEASDGSNTVTQELTFTITDVNEHSVSAPTDADDATNQIAEDATAGTAVGITASASDADGTYNTVSYGFTNGNQTSDDNLFSIDPNSGIVKLLYSNSLDYETATSHDIAVKASSSDGSSATHTFTIDLIDVNEHHVSFSMLSPDADSSPNQISEDAAAGTAVGITASASDPDGTNNTISYSLTNDSQTSADNLFSIASDTGIVTLASGNSLDYETATSHDIAVKATSSDGSSATHTFTIDLTDVNEHYVVFDTEPDADSAPNQIAEDAAAGTAVGITASASDGDGTNNTISYSFDNDSQTSADNLFSIASDTGIVTLANGTSLDYETATSHDIAVKASSSDGSSTTNTFTVAVTDVDEFDVSFATEPDADNSPNQISEDAAAGTAVGITASASDPDGTNNTISYSLTNDSQTSADNLFSIASDTGIVTLASGNSLDYETATSHDIAVKATSSDGSSATHTFTIDVTDVNDNTPIITPSQSFDIDEASANDTPVGTVALTDADSEAVNTFTWSITAGNTNDAFAIDPSSGELTVNTSSQLDTETTPGYTLSLTVSDGANTSSAETVTININDLNDNLPVITASQSFSINENSANATSVGTVLATDADATVTTYQDWTITGGNTNNAFAINDSTGELSVADASQLDYETTSTSYSLSITVSDGANTSSAETVTISVNDLNDNLPIIAASQSFSVDENSANGTSLGAVAATDADATATTYQDWTITSGNTNSAFAIDPDTGELTVNTSSELDTETTPSYSLSITVSDGANTASAETVTINVTDLNDNTPIITASQSFDIDEASANGTSVGTVALTDADSAAVNTFTWSITAGNTNNAFAIDPSSGELTVNTSSELDYESGTILYTLSLTVSDGATTSAAEEITINILDVSEHDAAPNAAYLGLPDNYINITFTPESGVSYQLHRSFVEGCTSSTCDAEGYKSFASPNSSGTADTMTFSQTHYYSLVGDNSTTFTTSINDSDGAKLAALVAAQSLSTEYDLTNDWVNISATDSNNVTYTLYMAGEPFVAGGCEDSELDNIGSLCADGSSLSDGSMHSATEVINWSARRYYRLDISDGYQVVHSLESNASVIDPVVLNASNASLTIDITWSALNSAKLAEYTVYLSDDSAATTASADTWSSLSNPQIISGNSGELYSLVPILSQYYVAITATNTENETTPLSKVYLVNNIVTGDPDPSTWHEIIADTDDSPAHWEGRSTHGSLVFQDKMWLIGGRTASENHIAEVWSSTDGYNWTEVNPSAAFGARKEFVSMVHDGKMWVLGGEIEGNLLANDVWYSSDGATWHEATPAASWHVRDYFGGVAFASGATGSDEMWVLGHYTGDARGIPGVEDHHYSTDGSTWSSVSVSGLPPSSFFPAITFNNVILIVGGYFYTNSAWSESNTIYSSTDGVNWAELSVSGSIWDARRLHTTLVYDDKLWILAGYSGYNRDDYWYSPDGTQWHEAIASGSKWEARKVHTSVNYAGRMWMLGGEGSTGDRQLNDVWASGLEITSFSFNLATTN